MTTPNKKSAAKRRSSKRSPKAARAKKSTGKRSTSASSSRSPRKSGRVTAAKKTKAKITPKSKSPKAPAMALSAVAKQVVAMKSTSNLKALLEHAHPLSWFKPGKSIVVCDKMQRGYEYALEEPVGKNFAEKFQPVFTPAEMLSLGVFEGKYLNDCVLELPREWLEEAVKRGKLCPGKPDYGINEFQIKSRSSLQQWRQNGWIPILPGDKDCRGWFQWYCRYYLGRRMSTIDTKQINRWNAIKRHRGQILASYKRLGGAKVPKTKAAKRAHRPRQRQCLLQWSYDPYC